MTAWLRYIVDRIAARLEPHCVYDWNDEHNYEACTTCKRIAARNVRIARYRRGKCLPAARLL